MPRPDWYVFPFGKPQPTDPTKPMTTLKSAWAKVKQEAGVKGRFHDTRHTFITDLAESGEADDETIRDLDGHLSKEMLKHCSHIRMEAKRRALEAIACGQVEPPAERAAVPALPMGSPEAVPKESPKVGLVN